jgi:Protein of unknown function (DUF3102)
MGPRRRELIQDRVAALQGGASHIVRVGQYLARAKELIAHGEWLPWVEKNFPFKHRTAQHYIRFAESHPELVNAHPDAHFNYQKMLKLAAPKEEPADDSGETDKPAELPTLVVADVILEAAIKRAA